MMQKMVDGVLVDITPDELSYITEHQDWQVPQRVPASVSPRQIRQALTRAGMREAVEQAVLAGDQDLKDWWDYSAAFERHHEQVLVMADALGTSAQQLDDLWILASEL